MSIARSHLFLGPLVLTLAAAQAAAGEPIEPLSAIAGRVESFLEVENAGYDPPPEVAVGRLDSRLRMPACDAPLEAFLPAAGRTLGNVTVGVRCAGARPWTLYVPAEVRLVRPVLVTRRPLTRGTTLTETDVVLEERDVSGLRKGYLSDPAAVVGLRLERSLRAGYALSTDLVAPPRLVRRGERVTVVARVGGLEVRSHGRALEDGVAGQTIAVENAASSRVVEGVVARAGVVQVRL